VEILAATKFNASSSVFSIKAFRADAVSQRTTLTETCESFAKDHGFEAYQEYHLLSATIC